MDLSIIIANWNGREVTERCLRSIFDTAKGLTFEVMVIDNGSTDGSVEMIKKNFSQVRLILNPTNTGFVFANNQGMAASRGDFVWLLNNDTVVRPDALQNFVAYMRAHPRVGVAGCHLVNPDGSHQYSVRRLPKLFDQIIVLTKMHNFFPGLLKQHLQFDFDFSREQSVEQVMGACLMIRREVIQQVGLLDKNIWSWFEDVDYCQRVRAAGWDIGYTSKATVMHLKSHSFAKHLALPKQRMLNKSMLYYFRKHHGWGSVIVLWPFTLLSLALACGVQLFHIKKRNRDL
ncbi:glycosyltransferase family 2 protein [Candidatus Falkowbacteria bacterium]|nr:glycosyltransferase family 2 protein [Candidatus Falkowbacteria bacterium]